MKITVGRTVASWNEYSEYHVATDCFVWNRKKGFPDGIVFTAEQWDCLGHGFVLAPGQVRSIEITVKSDS